MSHTAKISAIKISSVSALRSAIAELQQAGVKCSLVESATPRAYFPQQQDMGHAEFVIKLDDAPYDIGLYKQPDGTYEARTDFWMGHVERVLGAQASKPEKAEQAKMGKLFQMYGIHAATEAAKRKGLAVRRINGENGKIKLEVTGAAL